MMNLLVFLTLSVSFQAIQTAGDCSFTDVLADDCPYKGDGVCDATWVIGCESANVDCIDCDECRNSDNTSCETCTSGGDCVWCLTGSGYGLCSSIAVASALPGICSLNGGTEYIEACDVDRELPTCDILNDRCAFQLDLECDADGFLCAFGDDCYDCDPCQAYRSSCSLCIENGCEYCETESGLQSCSSSAIAAAVPNACGVPYVSICSDVPEIDLENDPCVDLYQYDFECDVDNGLCPAGSDVFDCDDCQQFSSSCEECTSNGCQYCEIPYSTGIQRVCSSAGIVAAIQYCEDEGGSVYTSECSSLEGVCETDLTNDSCQHTDDSECDANGSTCPLCSDFIDCDPCLSFASSCEECTENGCMWCSAGNGFSRCSSPDIAKQRPSFCSDRPGGTPYADTCGALTTDSCDASTDTCPFQFDGICDANGLVCPFESDCFDCSQCQTHRFGGCEECTANGCQWCAADAVCLSAGSSFPDTLSCSASDLVSTCSTGSNTFSDPLFDAQSWAYDLINIRSVWDEGIMGTGIGIRVNDDGIDSSHDEFNGKFDVSSSCTIHTPVRLGEKHNHGTACASLAAGGANNGCAVGIAPNARLSACRIIPTAVDDVLTPEAEDSSYLYTKMENMHISSNSWGVSGCERIGTQRRLQECPFTSELGTTLCTTTCASVDWNNPDPSSACEAAIASLCGDREFYENNVNGCADFLDLFVRCGYYSLPLEEQKAFITGTSEGRDGKGIIYVFASSNGFDVGEDVNFLGYQNSRHVISVGAVGRRGQHSSYSTSGAALFVSAPGGDFEFYTNNVVALGGGGCTDATIGTSFAAPVVSGVVALMLEVNPNLSWRDVQGILATTSQNTDPTDPTWTTNSAGLQHSYLYGFGVVDAAAAVNAARSWELYSNEVPVVVESGAVNLPIPDFPASPVFSSVNVVTDATVVVETAVVYVDLVHASRGDLEVVLVSSGGTESILHPGKRPENSVELEERWKLMTVRNWGEFANGEWTLRLNDRKDGDLEDCVDLTGWNLEVDGFKFDCFVFEIIDACANGGEGSDFLNIFGSFASSLSDPNLEDANGETPASACCSCGGGQPVSQISDVFKSWGLALYGHRQDPAASQGPVPPPRTTPTSSPTSQPTSAPFTEQPITKSPVPPLTDSPVTVSPVRQPTRNPISQPTVAPSTERPVTESPVPPPTESPVTGSPVRQTVVNNPNPPPATVAPPTVDTTERPALSTPVPGEAAPSTLSPVVSSPAGQLDDVFKSSSIDDDFILAMPLIFAVFIGFWNL